MSYRWFLGHSHCYGNRRSGAGPQPYLETLENRTLLTANLRLIDAYVSDSQSHNMEPPAVGSQAYITVEFDAVGLSPDAVYVIDSAIDGEIKPHTVSWGAGSDGIQRDTIGTWVVKPGPHTLSVTLDASNQIEETTKADNSTELSFTPITFPGKFVQPLAPDPYSDWTIVNYVDLDPNLGSTKDYMGGTYTLDGHTGIDFTLSSFGAMDRGVPVHAVADGVVLATHDGAFDRSMTVTAGSTDPGNYVIIDHGGGWQTWYFHLRNGSVMVKPGDHVYAGDVVGLVGSSGNSDAPHLHFEVEYRPFVTNTNPFPDPVETYVDPDDYWVSPLPYAGDKPEVLNTFITDHQPTVAEMKEGGPDKVIFAETPEGQTFYSCILVAGLKSTDRLDSIWHAPDGRTSMIPTITGSEIRYGLYVSSTNLYRGPHDDSIYSGPYPGLWAVQWLLNGTLLTDEYMAVYNSKDFPGGIVPKDGVYLAGYGKNDYGETASFMPYVNSNAGLATVHVIRTGSVGVGTVDYKTADGDGTAVAGRDYTSTSGTISFADGEMSKTFTIPIINNGAQPPRTLFVKLTNATGDVALVTDPVELPLTILAPDPKPAPPLMPAPTASIDSVTVLEKNQGTTDAVFTVTLDKAVNVPVMVLWTTTPASSNWQTTEGTATAGVDYQGQRGILTFAPGETTKTITIKVIGNWLASASVYFVVNLTATYGNGAQLGQKQGIGTIVAPPVSQSPPPPPQSPPVRGPAPPPAQPALSIDDVVITAKGAGTTSAIFTITLSAPSDQAVTVQYATVNSSAKAGPDYIVVKRRTLKFAPGVTSKRVTIKVKGDKRPDLDEAFFVALTSPTNATLAKPSGKGTIHIAIPPRKQGLKARSFLPVPRRAGPATTKNQTKISSSRKPF